MVGTSRHSYNLGAYFENSKFSARVQYNYRSKFLNGLDRNSAIYQDAVGTLRISGLQPTDNISLTLEGKDLNNHAEVLRNNTGSATCLLQTAVRFSSAYAQKSD
jgi:hypothetical protein